MTREEKARAYDEALERARALRQEAIDKEYVIDYVKDYETIFPELAESEDERIIKLIRSLLEGARNVQSNTSLYKQYDDALAWLEKQKYDRMQPVYDNLDSFESALAKAWKEYNDSGSRTVDGCEEDYVECAHAKGFREGYLFGLEKQKETNIDRLHKISTPADENWFEIQKQWEKEDEDERIRKEIIEYLKLVDKGEGDYAHPMVSGWIAYLEKQKEPKPIIQDVELNDAVYDYVRDHFIAGADFTPEYIKKLMENAFFAGVDYYLLKQESESCEPDTNVEKVIEDVIRVYGKTQGEWVGGYDVDTLIVNLRRAFNKKEQKSAENPKKGCPTYPLSVVGDLLAKTPQEPIEFVPEQKPAEWSYPYGVNETADRLVSLAECLEMDGDCLFNECSGTEWGKFLRELARKQIGCKPVEWSEEDERKYQCIRNILLTDMDKKVGLWKYSEILEWYEKRGIGRYTNFKPHWRPSEEKKKETLDGADIGYGLETAIDILENGFTHYQTDDGEYERKQALDVLIFLLNETRKKEDAKLWSKDERIKKEQKPVEPSGKLSRQDYLYQLLIDQLITYSDYEYLIGQNPAWSEEDETRFTNILIMLKEYLIHHYSKDDIDKSVDWLENRVKFLRPQSKQEWSEKDEDVLQNIIQEIEWERRSTTVDKDIRNYDRQLNFLKSLPMRCPKSSDNWKPSEEQMSALQIAAMESKTDFITLTSLLADLKKLM